MLEKSKVRLIAHALIKINDKYLVIKRTSIKRGKPNTLPSYWDIPGGMVELGEKPQECAIRETKEEVNLDIIIGPVLHEDSVYDKEKDTIFTRLVYEAYITNGQNAKNIILDKEEHSEFKLVNDIKEIDKPVDYLDDAIEHAKIYNYGQKYLNKEKKPNL